MTRKIDTEKLRGVSLTLAELYLKAPPNLQKKLETIARQMLKLAEENEQRRNILDDVWPMITAEQRLRINVKYMKKELAARKGDGDENNNNNIT